MATEHKDITSDLNKHTPKAHQASHVSGGGDEIPNLSDAITKRHSQHTDQYLDQGGANQSTAVDVKDAVDKKHAHANQAELDLVTDGDHDVRADNPHAVTKTQVSLGNVTNDAQMKRSANDYSAISEKTSPHDNDVILMEDNEASYVKKKVKVSNLIGGSVPTGAMMMWGTDTPPSAWLLCYGQEVSRTTYADLFAVIGTTFGVGDGSTTFNLPDMRGRLPLGQDDMGGASANRVTDAQADSLGGNAGAENHTLTTGEMPTHRHTLNYSTSGGSGGMQVMDAGPTFTNKDVLDDTGGGNAHNNMPPYLTLNYIIKT